MSGILIVNPRATTTTANAREVIQGALAYALEVRVVETQYAGHARDAAAEATRLGADIVLTYGGDGTVHEAVNGMMSVEGSARTRPMFAALPGGSANVFSRACGLPTDPIEATGEVASWIRERRLRTITVGRANDRWFVCNAGLGLDAEIIEAMEAARARGKDATPARYFATTLRQFFTSTDRRLASQVVTVDGHDPIRGVFLTIVQNTAPWTYLGALPVGPNPGSQFELGLDAWALQSMSIPVGLRQARRFLAQSPAPDTRYSRSFHDVDHLRVACHRPTSLQVDGEGLGLVERVDFSCVREALRVAAAEVPLRS